MEWNKQTIHEAVERQRAYFRTGATLDVEFRLKQLKKLKKAVLERQDELTRALREDLGRSEAEAYFCDVGSTIAELNETIAGLRKWAKSELHYSGMMCFPSVLTKVHKMPYGVTLIISPFNFPVLLTLGVLTAAIAGGNTAVIKTSSKSPATTEAMKRLISDTFLSAYVCLVDGGHDIADLCLAERFDKIFYTGSPKVGRHILEMAAPNLTPVALELGGETGNWCIVRKDANLKDAARKIAFFKICNSGQICININQVAVAKEVAEEFVNELKKALWKQIGDALHNEEYPHLISKAAFEKCGKIAAAYQDRIVYGGKGDIQTLRFEPTVIAPVRADEEIVQHELFSPLLPVVPFEDAKVDELLETIAEREHGLALYLFTRDMKWANRVMATQQYGGGCINEVCLQIMAKGVPFGGTGHSGMGAYHGEWGFREFTHPSTVLIGSTRFNLPLREHPYTGKAGSWKLPALKMFER